MAQAAADAENCNMGKEPCKLGKKAKLTIDDQAAGWGAQTAGHRRRGATNWRSVAAPTAQRSGTRPSAKGGDWPRNRAGWSGSPGSPGRKPLAGAVVGGALLVAAS